MEFAGRSYACRRGEMELSVNVARLLEDYIRRGSPSQSATTGSVRWGTGWFCPADGTPMTETSGGARCPGCQQTLPGTTLYHLIELHPHLGWPHASQPEQPGR
jgi:hypothetical protein